MIILKINENNYEYPSPKELSEDKARYVKVPMPIIINTELYSNRVAIYAYISMYKGLNNKVIFSVPRFLDWAGFKSDTHSGGINEKIIDSITGLSSNGYLNCLDSTSKTSSFELKMNTQFCYEASENDFSLLYIDEIEKIMSYRRNNPKDAYLNSFSVLLVFAFLRRQIFRRPNELKIEERNPDRVKERKERCPEAYNTTYKDLALEIGLSERIVSESVKILVQLQLIVFREAYHVMSEKKGHYITPDTMFANYEKREKSHLLDWGLNYANDEMERKAILINKHSKFEYKLKDTTINSNELH